MRAQPAKRGGSLRCGYNPKNGEFGTGFVKREGLRNLSCSKGGSWVLIDLLSLLLLVNMINRWDVFWQTEKGGS